MSLRARLILTLLALSAAGMLVLGAVTYATQRSFQQDRVDEQARAALPAVSHQLDERGFRDPAAPERFEPRGGGPPGGRPDAAGVTLPPGTYGQRRDASGRVLGSVALSYGEPSLPAPDLPADITAGATFTVGAKGNADQRYRVHAEPGPGGGLTIAAIPLNAVEETLDRLLLVEALVIASVLVLVGVLASSLVRIGLRPLERIGQTAGAIAAGDLSRRVDTANPRTEVGRLGVALNAMLGRLETAFAEREASESRLRRFLADASHELRTPLASIRGYAELFRIGAARDSEETERAMARIEDEATRMGVLVEDLLTLARLGEVRETTPEAVDVAQIAEDAVADARAMDPDRPIQADVDGEAIVLGDTNQLRQVLANLVRNALVHTPPGTPIEVFARHEDDHVELEVRDHGPGLPPTEDPAELFERFWRVEGGRRRGRAGAGLGLAIVAAIVAAHQGEVQAANAPGGGASFVVRLPLAAHDPAPPRLAPA